MKFTTQISAETYLLTRKLSHRAVKTPSFMRTRNLGLAVALLVLPIMVMVVDQTDCFGLCGAPFADNAVQVVLIVLTLVGFYFWRQRNPSFVELAGADQIGSWEIELTAEGLRRVGRQQETLYRWAGFRSIETVNQRLMLYFGEVLVIPIPLHGIDKEIEGAIRDYVARAQPAVVGG